MLGPDFVTHAVDGRYGLRAGISAELGAFCAHGYRSGCYLI